jgi:hypothetical protein
MVAEALLNQFSVRLCPLAAAAGDGLTGPKQQVGCVCVLVFLLVLVGVATTALHLPPNL